MFLYVNQRRITLLKVIWLLMHRTICNGIEFYPPRIHLYFKAEVGSRGGYPPHHFFQFTDSWHHIGKVHSGISAINTGWLFLLPPHGIWLTTNAYCGIISVSLAVVNWIDTETISQKYRNVNGMLVLSMKNDRNSCIMRIKISTVSAHTNTHTNRTVSEYSKFGKTDRPYT